MKHFAWQWLAASSLLLGLMGQAETRPRYGGTLRIEMHAAPQTLDPADASTPDSFGRRSITHLIFDTLVTTNRTGEVEPALADSWQFTRGTQRYIFRLRHNVTFQDGTPITSEVVAASLRFANPSWTVLSSGDSVVVEDPAAANLLAELALPRNAIVKRNAADGKLIGTGPFQVASWDRSMKLVLSANESCWRGRPYLDGVEIELGKNFHDQNTAMQLGRADLVEIAPEQAHRSPTDGRHMAKSAPLELLALLFVRDATSDDEKNLRSAIGYSVERNSIYDVLLKRAGQSTGSILPTWISGYGFVFPASADLARARQLRSTGRNVRTWKLGYDGADALDRLLAERIALNASDAGLSVQPMPSGAADIRLVRIPLASSDGWTALQEFLQQCGMPQMPTKENSIADLYAAEREVLASGRVIPLFHLPAAYASTMALRGWTVRTDGSLGLASAWLETTKP